MTYDEQKAARFAALHRDDTPLLMPNAWDAGSARLFESLGFHAVATTSSGFAATLGRLDGGATRDEVLAHSAALAAATDIPVSGDFEQGFADAPEAVAGTIALARDAGLAGCSIEDYSGRDSDTIYELGLATDRIRAAADAAHAGGTSFVLTARAENLIRGIDDLGDTIKRLQAYQEAGADVVFAPGLATADDIRAVVTSVDVPVSVLGSPLTPTIPEMRELGVARISVGGGLAYAAYGAAVTAAKELRDEGTFGFWSVAGPGMQATKAALGR
jgi:2-methylisocitrate lyase-like PEP mutase family enzyme